MLAIGDSSYIQGDPASFRWPNWVVQPNWFMVAMGEALQDNHTMVRWLAVRTIRTKPSQTKPK